MKVTFVAVEGTPEELGSSDLIKQMLSSISQGGNGSMSGGTSGSLPELEIDDDAEDDLTLLGLRHVHPEGQAEVQALLAENPSDELFLQFLDEAGSWGRVKVHGIKRKGWQEGQPLDYSGYLRLRRTGSQLGGFAYAFARTGVVNLRLQFDSDVQNRAPQAYEIAAGNPQYRVNVQIVDEDSLAQALDLAKLAYEGT